MSINNKQIWWWLGVITALIVSLLFVNQLLIRVDLAVYDLQLWFKSLFTINQQEQIVIVTIDEASLEQIGSWPWPRSMHAQLLTKLRQAGAKTIGVDLVFDFPSQPEEDKKLARAVTQTENLYFPSVLKAYRQGETINIQEIKYPLSKFRQAGSKTGYINLFPDRDGKIRRINLLSEAKELRPLAFKLAANFSQRKRKFSQRELLINFHRQVDYFPQVSYQQIINGNYKQGLFTNKLVLVGPADNTLGDYFMTPLGDYRPGVRIQAEIIDNYLENSFISPAATFQVVLAILLFSLLTAGLYFYLTPLRGVFLSLVVGSSLVGGSTGLLVYCHFYFPVAALELVLILNLISSNLISYLQSEQQRTHLKTVFSRYLAPQVMEEVISLPEQKYLSGQRRAITVLFVDLSGFTSFAEHKTAEEIVTLLNKYFSMITEQTFAQQGTLNKFLGDGAMIFFGAPTSQPDHALRAVKLAVNIQQAVADNSELLLPVSIGINTGEAVVGNIGSFQRTDYTAIGDVVNTAARIEAEAKAKEILLGAATYKLLPESYSCRLQEDFNLPGKKKTVNLYQLIYQGRDNNDKKI